MGSSWRQAYGAFKDSTKVGLAKVNSGEYKELDTAVVKATTHVELPPKERHVRKIFDVTNAQRSRSDVAYCIYALARRLAKTHTWTVALKILIVIHRTMREGDSKFSEELLNYCGKGNIFDVSHFKDDSSPLAWDCSLWIRAYARYLWERLECFRILKFDIERERLVKHRKGSSKMGHSRTRTLDCADLLEQLPALQQVLSALIKCQPERTACGNFLIQYALAMVLKESIKIYCAINDGIINLVDKFFEMSKHDAIEALDIYQRTGEQTQNLSDFYEFCKTLALARVFQFPTLKQPPEAFLVTMDDYIREAPAVGQVSSKKLEYVARKEGEDEKLSEEDENSRPADVEEQESKPGPQDSVMGDLLSFDEVNPIDANLEENNALALAILPPGEDSKSSTNLDFLGGDSLGWESTLDTNSSSLSHPDSNKLGGELSQDLLNSLYENSDRMRQISEASGGGVSANPFDSEDLFPMPGNIAPPPNVDTPFMVQLQQQQLYYQQLQQYYQQQQQHQQYYQQQMMMVPYQAQNPQPQVASGNPFADIGCSQDAPQLGNSGMH